MKSPIFVILALGLLLSVGCATSSGSLREFERGPDTVQGSPPAEDSEDYEFAPPPQHPGFHGEVASRTQVQASMEREPGVIGRAEIRQLMDFGPAIVWEHVDTEPQHEDGRFVGFMIVDLSTRAHDVLAPDLRVGDVVTHVNLVKLERPDHYMEVWAELPEASEIRIDFLRDGQQESAVWQVR